MVTMASPARRDEALPDTYLSTLEELKTAVRTSQARARMVVITELPRSLLSSAAWLDSSAEATSTH